MPRILIVEDNPDLAFGLRNNLEIEGYEITVAEDGLIGLDRARTLQPDLIILDLMMPGLDGYRVLRTLREEGFTTPVMILSARGEEADKVRGFRVGADDFVTKPFSLLELLARVQALLRRGGAPPGETGGETYHFGDIVVDVMAQRVTRAGELVSLTHREFALLMALLRRQGGVATRQELLREVWGYRAVVMSRTVDTHVAGLRRKLEGDAAQPSHIVTVRKTGYRLQD
ncbi:MAG TPA: response regulator transcription factor [Longimicrobiales bacterium]|nr:response regulator transcription factor [Longimicrobiales bacterium]